MKDLALVTEDVNRKVVEIYRSIEPIELSNHKKVINAFRESKVSAFHLGGSTGYGYDDAGREKLEEVFSRVFQTEDALVRGQIVSGTHAIALCLYGILKNGDLLLTVQGKPYDTLEKIIGYRSSNEGSLASMGVRCRQIDLLDDGTLDWERIDRELRQPVKMVLIQRSCGYSLRPSLNMAELSKLCSFIKARQSDTIIFVDNCYGEFVEESEPPENGADIIAGSLIKNPGGGLAPTGGYVAGKKKLVEMAANRLTAPGIGAEVGPTLGWQRLFFQGFYLAPHLVMEALRGAIWAAMFFEELGFEVFPLPNDMRTDIVQAVILKTPERMEAFCRGIQGASPVDNHVTPVPSPLPGYEHQVIMAAGTFVQGASLEFTADAPVREPYTVYFQGGLSHAYTKIGLIEAAREVLRW
ncbi:Cystathionine beta-lyase family protein involved in aluminum resistance [Desulfotomaculum arcticum]|uniref:Cystathionine beta-lyase family protein involved in aluminum resistance n=1 Tax=Desulfotruncus arcticus DSM 17038 TaxID=1121424 RepID=A0A1I2S276_9FIRM|nr:methionine gamma-lyase family protein [Desulfotruncus arcticus]SFG46433.1 Cystathionine beta-lyase family protein involved in aluminum resistance [Desulfotomaculum arcticum] [Desulfotruncus arcticus DSM 17038]